MTICIAATCEGGKTIIIAADRQIGLGFTSAEFPGGKYLLLFDDWSVGFSGTVANANDVIGNADRLVAPGPAARRKLPKLSLYDARGVMEKGYREARLKRAEGLYLASRGMTLEEFRKTGVHTLPPTTYAEIDARIANFDFNTDLIVAGFGDGEELGTVFTVTNPGVTVEHTLIGFWCVGSGAAAAQMSIFNRLYSRESSAEEAVYYLYEAKRSAENAAGVGRTTDIYINRKGRTPVRIGESAMKKLDKIYQKLKVKDFNEAHRSFLKEEPEFKSSI
jgi:hypothetical protein